MIYFHKILPLLFSPLFLIISLIVFGLILSSKKISFAGVAILVIFSMPIVSGKLIAYLESDYELIKPSKVESADAVVVLSGMIKTIQTKNGLDYEWGGAVDRFFKGEEFRALESEDDKTYLLSKDSSETPAALIAELNSYKKEVEQLKKEKSTVNIQSQYLEKQFKTYLHAILKKWFEKKEGDDYWTIIQVNFQEIHLHVESLRTERLAIAGPEGAKGSNMGYCNWPHVREIIKDMYIFL